MLKPLERSQQDYISLMERVLALPTLDLEERTVFDNLLTAVRQSLKDFDAMRHVATSGRFSVYLWSAIDKARAAGITA